jgi:hypothetical protein
VPLEDTIRVSIEGRTYTEKSPFLQIVDIGWVTTHHPIIFFITSD